MIRIKFELPRFQSPENTSPIIYHLIFLLSLYRWSVQELFFQSKCCIIPKKLVFILSCIQELLGHILICVRLQEKHKSEDKCLAFLSFIKKNI